MAETKNKAVIVSYDLGLKGDYRGLFTWLDTMKALECGNSVGVFTRDFATDQFEEILEMLKAEISAKVKLEPSDRIYIFMKNEKGSMRGKFIFGHRKRAPWEGYAAQPTDDTSPF